MTKQFAIEVRQTDDGFVATSPQHPGAHGFGESLATSLAELAKEIERTFAGREPQTVEVGPESAETACRNSVDEVDFSASPIHGSAEEGRMTMPQQQIDPVLTGTPSGRPIPGALEWIKEHAQEFEGRWVAIGPEGLVADAATFEELEARLPTFQGVLIGQMV
jgi:predicted RNase H-like HicB family nuclease